MVLPFAPLPTLPYMRAYACKLYAKAFASELAHSIK
jgi:hypothetical protein